MVTVTCKVQATFASTIEKGDIVALSTSGNWTINSTAANFHIKGLGEVVDLDESNAFATVRFFRGLGVARLRAGAAITLGHILEASHAHTNGVKGSANASGAAHYLVAVSYNDPTGYCEALCY